MLDGKDPDGKEEGAVLRMSRTMKLSAHHAKHGLSGESQMFRAERGKLQSWAPSPSRYEAARAAMEQAQLKLKEKQQN